MEIIDLRAYRSYNLMAELLNGELSLQAPKSRLALESREGHLGAQG